jgi:hypothetical protein
MSELEVRRPVIKPSQVGYLVLGEWCDRCGDTNYDARTRVCLTCTFPDDPCSRAYLEARPA